VPLDGQSSTISRCEWEDLALLTVSPSAFPSLDFFNAQTEWIDPSVGEMLNCIGFPFDHNIIWERKVLKEKREVTLALYPTVISARVLPPPTGDELKFQITSFDQHSHYLVPFDGGPDGNRPQGISGAAMWWESDQKQLIWRPDFRFAGICVCSYKRGAVVQVVKASVVRRFLEEVFGKSE